MVNRGGKADPLASELRGKGWQDTPWHPDLFDWLMSTGRHVLVENGFLVVPGWVSTAMKAYGSSYADMSIIEFLNRLSGIHQNDI